MHDFDYIVCGNNIGAMAAAALLGKNHKVAVVNPTPNWGGIFAGIKINGGQFDIGMAILEFPSFYPKTEDLLSHSPAVYNDSARFVKQVEAFWARRLKFAEFGNIKTFLNGAFYDDIIYANQMQVMSSLSKEPNITAELEAIKPSALHAANKKKQRELFLSANYEDVSVANHGKTLHELLVAPLCQKALNISARQIPALFHRLAWCPLYYPETLLAAAHGEDVNLPQAKFLYPKAGYFAQTAEVLAAEIQQNAGISILQKKPTAIADGDVPAIHLDGDKITAKKIIWCGDLAKLCALSNANTTHPEMQRASMVMAFVETEKENTAADFSSAFVCDVSTGIYRANNQNAAHPTLKTNKFIFEMNADYMRQNGADEDGEIIAHVRQFCDKAQIFNTTPEKEKWAVRRFNNALVLPTADNYKNFIRLQESAQFRNIECVGTAACFGGGSLNDQVTNALYLKRKYCPD